jgi:SAM-dependent methyltransferase
MQVIRDFSKKPFGQLQILDLACGEGVYAVEAALRGAEVKALDARTERMGGGMKAAERLGLANLSFEQEDIRHVTRDSHGQVDIVLLLGILYHLDQQDAVSVLKNVHDLCTQFVIIDTHIAVRAEAEIEHNGLIYKGRHFREHAEDDSEDVRRGRLLASVDNPTSFWFTKESLFRLLKDVGFTSVCECSVPLEPFKPQDRITIIAAKGEPVQVSSYPWVNEKTEREIEHILADDLRQTSQGNGPEAKSVKQRAESSVNGLLRRLGLKIVRV